MLYKVELLAEHTRMVWDILHSKSKHKRDKLEALAQEIMDKVLPEPYDADIYSEEIDSLLEYYTKFKKYKNISGDNLTQYNLSRVIVDFVYSLHEVIDSELLKEQQNGNK